MQVVQHLLIGNFTTRRHIMRLSARIVITALQGGWHVPFYNLNLTPTEKAAYEIVCKDGLRIEQEHLSDTAVKPLLAKDH